MNSFNDAFEDLIKDMYNAEKQVSKALPKVMKTAQDEQLKQGIQKHIQETEAQMQRLEQIAEMCGFKPTGKVCKAAQGLIEEVKEHMEEGEPGPLMDAVLTAGAQKFEHYEISNYGTAREWAKLLGKNDVVRLLEQSLREEEQMDAQCTQLAESKLNRAAMQAPAAEAKSQRSAAKSRTASTSSRSAGTARTSGAAKGTARSGGPKGRKAA